MVDDAVEGDVVCDAWNDIYAELVASGADPQVCIVLPVLCEMYCCTV